MKNTSFFLTLLSVIISYTSCTKEDKPSEQDIVKNDTVKQITDKMFIGVHTRTVTYPTVFDLIVGYTNSDSSFTRTDSIRGPYMISSNMDKHTSTLNKKGKVLYFIYRHSTNYKLQLGFVNTNTGKYIRSVDLGIQQTDMIHLQYNETDGNLYFSMGPDMYLVDDLNGSLSHVRQQQNNLNLPESKTGGDTYLSHIIGNKRFLFVKDNESLMHFDRFSNVWDSISLDKSGSYRSLVADPADESILYAFKLIGNTHFNLVKFNLKDGSTTNTVTQNSNCHILWFQARFNPVSKLYTCLPFDHQTFPYFISMNVETGKSVYYPTPSHLGQCLLD